MSTDRVAAVESKLDSLLEDAPEPATTPASGARMGASSLTLLEGLRLFEDQFLSRTLDVVARELKRDGRSYYTISSAGHEQNALVAAQLSLSDPCFLHYRSGAFMMRRWRQQAGSTPAFDTLLSLCASSDDPISGGRHKVWGSRELWVPPQTSTIASHVPKAVGAAYALARARRLEVDPGLASDAIVACSFGDASINHASALVGINAARYARRHGTPTPILFICEDNHRGISVETPEGWIADMIRPMTWIEYVPASGSIESIWESARQAVELCRHERIPVFLHLDCVRLWGHAGSDIETTYRSTAEIEADEARDPLFANAQALLAAGASPGQLLELVRSTRTRVRAAAQEAAQRPKLSSRAAVVAPLAPWDEDRCRARASAPIDPEDRRAIFGRRLPEEETSPTRRTLAAQLNSGLTDLMIRHPEVLVFGEDVGKKGGVYGLTANLQRRFGVARVFDTLLDETTILGVAQGAAQMGFLPICEIQYLAYLHNAIDQLRGEACSLSFFSNGAFTNPMVVRIAGFAYQKGFGGHFHNDNSIGALRDIPGLAIAAPTRGDDAVRCLRGAVAMALEHGRVVCFLEPIALYHERDLYEPEDGAWLGDYPGPGEALFPGTVGLYGDEDADVAIIAYANGLRLSIRAARRVEQEHGLSVRVIDLRWLAPLPTEAVRHHARRARAIVVVDECRQTAGGVADALAADFHEHGDTRPFTSVRAADTYIPLGPATRHVLVTEEQIVDAVREISS